MTAASAPSPGTTAASAPSPGTTAASAPSLAMTAAGTAARPWQPPAGAPTTARHPPRGRPTTAGQGTAGTTTGQQTVDPGRPGGHHRGLLRPGGACRRAMAAAQRNAGTDPAGAPAAATEG